MKEEDELSCRSVEKVKEIEQWGLLSFVWPRFPLSLIGDILGAYAQAFHFNGDLEWGEESDWEIDNLDELSW